MSNLRAATVSPSGSHLRHPAQCLTNKKRLRRRKKNKVMSWRVMETFFLEGSLSQCHIWPNTAASRAARPQEHLPTSPGVLPWRGGRVRERQRQREFKTETELCSIANSADFISALVHPALPQGRPNGWPTFLSAIISATFWSSTDLRPHNHPPRHRVEGDGEETG